MTNLRAFVSAAAGELHDERIAVRHALGVRGISAFVFEFDAGAGPESARQTYLDEIPTADIYVGILWNRYSKPTIEEYRRARELGKPCFVYVKDFQAQRDSELVEFLGSLSDSSCGVTYKHFDNVVELEALIATNVVDWLVREWRRQSAEGLSPLLVKRLEADARGVMELVGRDRRIEIVETGGTPPKRYVLRYRMASVIGIDDHDAPILAYEHLVELIVHSGYPASLPTVRFLTPIFHPHTFADGQLCMGWFALPYSLAEVCLHVAALIDLRVWSRSDESFSNRTAARWALAHQDLLPLSRPNSAARSPQ